MRWLSPPNVRRICGLLLIAVFLTSCAAAQFARRQPPKVYELTPKTTYDEDLPELQARITVESPSATTGLNTARIALRPDLTQLDYYAGVLWVDVVPVMVQSVAIESLDASGRIDALTLESAGTRPDYSLRLHIREFQAEYDNGTDEPPLVNVRLQARLLELPRRETVATTSAQHLERASGTSIPTVVRAYDSALGKVLKRLVEWTIEEIAEQKEQAVDA